VSRTIRRPERAEGWMLPWQHSGRCQGCGAKITGSRRVPACYCGGRVSYR
jgi:hypothetical protein